ncbi:hypothetical protein NHG68_15495 [Enterobacter sp. Z1]|uniref:hypothetical protein n=1 Tax=Enterobacter sp. Z1 TaxID=2561927 RepID=UPI0011E05104|nr:hypothetical protein [Enterobacter sp. Z1]TYD05489.1 hypothetical protein E4M14_009555 [Enterobacter sp. Z1]USX30413.1 hypothetical protein NHG68_15495 [Enterobacter sp. Z1]
MSTITKERATGIANGEKCYTHDDVVELARIALASLEAEAVAWRCGSTVTVNKPVADDWKRRGFAFHPLYAAPPAPVVPEEMPKGLAGQIISLLAHNIGDKFLAQKIWNACRAAMLQGADQATVKQPSSNSVLGWLRADYQDDNRGLRGNAPLFVLGKKDPSTVWGLDYIPLTSNSPVIGEGRIDEAI